MSADRRKKRIANYGLIGDGETAALVSSDGAIEWLCMPRFDSDACFAALLGHDDNGSWKIAPEGAVAQTSRRYLDETLVLETCFETEQGSVAVIDFMPIARGESPDIIRIVEGRGGTVRVRSSIALRFDNGRIHPLVDRASDGEVFAIAGQNGIAIRGDTPISHEDRAFESSFEIREGERCCFAMTWFASHEARAKSVDPLVALDETCSFWRDWIAKSCYEGPYRDLVMRSLVTLKAMIHRPTGGIIAAPTTSLPERLQGARNWDYRFCWLRDATFALLALLQAGLEEEATAWIGWLRRAIAGQPIEVQPFYTIDAGRRALEWEADWLSGFAGSKPVRFGNAASDQLQLDVYGEVADALFVATKRGRSDGIADIIRTLADRLEDCWSEPDAGIWESRGEPRQHTYSKVMCWVAFDRAARSTEGEEAERYRGLAAQVKDEVLARGYDSEQGSFTRVFDDKALDASSLRIPLVGFLPADDERVRGTVRAIEDKLMQDGFVRRYAVEATDDGVGGSEGVFLAASFWLADVYALQGRTDHARELFERVVKTANDIGLISEEFDPGSAELLGNFPQALSHLSLVTTALNLSGAGPAHARGDQSRSIWFR